MFASAVAWALSSILGKRHSSSRPAIVTTAWGMTFGWLALTFAFVAQRGWEGLGAVSASTWITVLLLGVASTGLACGLYFYALSSAEAALAAALQYLEPLVTMMLAAWWLGEQVTVDMLAGGALILLGVGVVDGARTSPSDPAGRERVGEEASPCSPTLA